MSGDNGEKGRGGIQVQKLKFPSKTEGRHKELKIYWS